MYRDALDPRLLGGSVLGVHGELLQVVQGVEAVNDLRGNQELFI